jgi:hypothetical protein
MLSEFYHHIKMDINFSNDGCLATLLTDVHAAVLDALRGALFQWL